MMELYQRLEVSWAQFNNLDPAGMVACASGTAALHLALEAMELPLGSKVIVPDFTMIACPRSVAMAGLTPMFVDCDKRLLMDEKLANDRLCVPSVIRVHVYGRRVAPERKWPGHIWIEDLAESHGIRPHESTDAACWSFYRNKIIAGEEGGAVWFRNPAHATLARQLRTLGFTEAHDFRHVPRGCNYRLSNLHAKPILDSIAAYPENVKERRRIEAECDRHCPDEWRMPPRDAPWVYDMRIPGLGWGRQDKLVRALNTAGVAARRPFKPMHVQEEFDKCRLVTLRHDHCEATLAAREVIYLPLTGSYNVAKAMELIKAAVLP